MKKSILLLLFIVTALAVNARTFTIMSINTPTIKINGRVLKAGDKFTEPAKIEWSHPQQAMRVKTDSNKTRTVSNPNYKKPVTFMDFIKKLTALTTRGGDETDLPYTEESLRDEFKGCHLLLDSLIFNVGWKTDEHSSFYVKIYNVNNGSITIPFKSEGSTIFLTRDDFDKLPGEPEEITLAIGYRDQNEDTVLADDVTLILVPASLDPDEI